MLVNRIGTFFFIIGLALIGMYILSDVAQTPSCNFLISGSVLMAIGIFLRMRHPAPPPQETGRFRILRSAGKKQSKPPDKKS